MKRRARRSFVAFASFLIASRLLTQARAADDSKVRCAAAYEQAQELRRQDKLSAAKNQLMICGQTCPRALASDCAEWQAEVDALMPTVRLRATDEHGGTVDARVVVDGTRVIDHIGDAPLVVDTGDHTFRFESLTGLHTEVHVSVHGGERERDVVGVLAPPSSPLPSPRRTSPAAALVTGAFGIVGLGVAGVLALKGHLDVSSLESKCAPTCNRGDVDRIRALYDAAWVAGGVGVASLAVSLLLWMRWHGTPSTSASALFVAPSPGGVGVGWTFR